MKLGKTVSVFEEVIQHFAKVLQSECYLGLQHPFKVILPLQSYIILQLIEKQKNRWSSGRGIERPRYSIFEVCKDMFNDDLAAREEGVALSIGIAQNAVFGLFFGKITATVCFFSLFSNFCNKFIKIVSKKDITPSDCIFALLVCIWEVVFKDVCTKTLRYFKNAIMLSLHLFIMKDIGNLQIWKF